MDKISFWQLLEGNKVVIPIIQRDYAQGRIGKEHVREKFLTQIKAALENPKNSGELDFVYGTKDNGVFYPLDGQQRLTTLWLLHWFVASKSGKLNDEAKERLKKFSYETRTSSREFCEKLCEFDISKVSKVSNAIQKQTWFYTAWKQDPTIQSMLRMIEGSEKKNQQGHDFIDGLEKLFDGCTQQELMVYWGKLTKEDCPIKFSKLEISSNELPVSDDLYIKMNARGKPLSDFENFKADLISSLKNDDAIKYGGLIDNNWTNHFWNKNEIDFFDAKWMAFLCRFAVCVRIENEEDSNEKVANVLKEWSVYKNDTDKSFLYEYKDFRDFEGVFNAGVLNRLNDIFEGWSKLSNLKDFTLDSSWEDKFCFIPSGNKNQAVSTLTMKTRVLFYGTMLFCEKLHFCKECGSFKDCLIGKWNAWKRVMWNLAENTNESSTLEGFVGIMKMFKQLGEWCLDIYNYLNEDGNKVEYDFEQLKEEKEKAKMILCNATGSSDWENKIIQAENHAFFHGAIRFLFHDQTGNVKWDDFDTKYQSAEKYFDKDGIKEDFKVSLTKNLVLQCTKWKEQLYEKQIFNPRKSTWRWILCAKNWEAPIHSILMVKGLENLDEKSTLDDDNNANEYVKPILENLPFEEIIKSEPDGRFRWNGLLAFYKPNARYAMFTLDWGDFKRNSLLQCLTKNKDFELQEQHIIKGSDQFYKGWDIHFKYENHCFLWGADNKIYLLDDKNQYKKDVEDRYLCFDAKDINCVDDFAKEIKKLVK